MQFVSSRSPQEIYSFKEAALSGRCPRGGVFLPASLPTFPENFLDSLRGLSFSQSMAAVLEQLISEDFEGNLQAICERAFNPEVFGERPFYAQALNSYAPYELVIFAEQGPAGSRFDYANALAREFYLYWGLGENTYLYSAPTPYSVISLSASLPQDCPFKALYFMDKRQNKDDLVHISDFLNEERAQGVYLDVDANESYQLYRDILKNTNLGETIDSTNFKLLPADGSSIISLLCQVALLTISLAMLKEQDVLPEEGVDLALPSDDIDFVLAFFYLKSLGFPLNICLIAENSNRLFSNFLRSGRYSLKKDFSYSKIPMLNSPWPAGFEALLFELLGRNYQLLEDFFQTMEERGQYTFPHSLHQSWRMHVRAIFNQDKRVIQSGRSLYDCSDYILDGGGAAAYAALQVGKHPKDKPEPALILSSQNPLWSLESMSEILFSRKYIRKLQVQRRIADSFVEESGINVPKNLVEIFRIKSEGFDPAQDGASERIEPEDIFTLVDGADYNPDEIFEDLPSEIDDFEDDDFDEDYEDDLAEDCDEVFELLEEDYSENMEELEGVPESSEESEDA